MSNSQVQLPQEIWTKILKYVPSTDLAAPLTVCHAWNILVKRRYYENIKFFRLSSIDRFIAYVKISLDHPNLRVKKITFTDFHLHTRHLSTFERRFHELMALCLQVQTLSADSEHLGSYVVKSLHSYPTRLKSLSSFPYASSHEYDACAYKYRNTLEDYVMNNCDYWSLNHFFKRIMIFRQLEKLSIRNASVITLKHLEYILSVCPHLEDLSMTQYYRPVIFEGSIDENDSDEYISDEYDNEGVISGFDSKKFSKMQQYPKVKRLSIKTTADDLLHLIPFLLKLNHLERLEIESTAIDRSIFQVQNHGLKENFKPFLNYISTLPYVSFIGKSIRFNQDPALAVSCLGFFLQSCTSWEHTSLKIRHYPVIELLYYNEFDYTVTNSKHRELTIALPEFQVNNSSIHTKYINTFAPFVNTLEVYYSFATKGKNACESFLYAALSQCAVLRSLTIFCVFDKCFITPEFLTSLSYTYVNLRNLTLSNNMYLDMKRFAMPQTERRQLDLDLGQFITNKNKSTNQTFIKISDSKQEWYFNIDFEKKQCFVLREKLQEECRVVFHFKMIERLRIFYGNDYDHILQLSK